MNNLEISNILKEYRERKYQEDPNKIGLLFGNIHNEPIIKEELFKELKSFNASESKSVDIDFSHVYTNIETRIRNSEAEYGILDKKMPVYRFLRIAAMLIFVFTVGGAASYFIFMPLPEAEVVAFNEIRAPLGARSEIILPDGSQVWLNAGSKLKYLNVFNKNSRMVSLEGEGYFKVAKNDKLPFNVKTGDLYIMAVGTEFNVKSYDDEGIIETTLVEGKVSIRRNKQNTRKSQVIVLEPHQKAVYVKEGQQLTIEDLKAVRQTKPEILTLKKGIMYIADKIDPEPIISWKENRLILKGEELSNLLIKLERKYDVSFEYETEDIKQFRFSGTLENETLTQVLDVIKLSAPIDYSLEGKTVKITENKQMSKKFSGHLRKK
jgi:ferric-dicitrate binding protein FerR (iron transport regulator)